MTDQAARRRRRPDAPADGVALAAAVAPALRRPTWWRDAVIYQVYVRSFADANGDGIGDLAGVRVAAAVPARPRRRRDLVHALVRLAAGRRRLRRRRLPRDRSGVRHARRGRGADRRGARARHPDDHRHRPQPRLGPAPLVPGGAGRRARLARARALLVPPGRGADGDEMPTAWRSNFPGRPGPGRRTPTARPASGTCTCSRPSSRTSTGTTPTSGASTRRSCASGSTAAWPASASTRPRCWSRTRRCPRSRPTRRPATTRPHDRDELHDIYRSWRAVADSLSRRRASSSARSGCADIERFAQYLRPDELHTAFNFDFLARPWDAAEPARVDRRHARGPRAGRGARRPGSSPTTT